MQRKIRVMNNRDQTFAINIPKQMALFKKETWFYVEQSGSDIILRSGMHIQVDDKTIKEYKFEDRPNA